MNQTISLKPGQIYEGFITINNPGDATQDFSYQASVTPYGVVDESYNADLASQSNHTMISKWTTIEEPTGTIKPNESKKIKFTIKVPEDAPAGGQYATISISSNPSTESSNDFAIQNIFEMASIIYADVAGKTIHSGEVVENNVPSFVFATPLETYAIITNYGNVHEFASYSVAVKDLFTGRVISSYPDGGGTINEAILPDTTRHIENQIDQLPAFGIVKVTQTINYNGQSSITERDVFICPIWFIVLTSVAIAAIAIAVVWIIKKHRRKFAQIP